MDNQNKQESQNYNNAKPSKTQIKIDHRATMARNVSQLVKHEFENAGVIHPPVFASPHEGYAIMLEELEEARDIFETIIDDMHSLWDRVKNDEFDVASTIAGHIENDARDTIVELIQLAAMCDKFAYSVSFPDPRATADAPPIKHVPTSDRLQELKHAVKTHKPIIGYDCDCRHE